MVKRKSLLRYTLLVIATFIFSASFAQNTFKTTTKSVIGYLEYLPSDYNSNSNKYPIVIFLHGLGERGACSTDYNTLKSTIGYVEKYGPPKYTKAGTQFPFILISPQLKNNYTDWPHTYVQEVLDYCRTYLRIDERRIYLTGLSLGGGGTWTQAQTYPKLWAAIAPASGSKNSVSMAGYLASENMPVWGFHGLADTTIPYTRTTSMVNAINACTPKPSPLAKVTLYPNVGHNCWTQSYQPDHTYQNPNVYEWMMSFTNTKNGSNKIPVCSAGADKTTSYTSLSVTGSGTDSDGSIASYAWTKISGPSVTMSSTTSACLKLSNMAKGTYLFRLRVTDNGGDSDSDYVKVIKN
jgi:dienelactone hydrolase